MYQKVILALTENKGKLNFRVFTFLPVTFQCVKPVGCGLTYERTKSRLQICQSFLKFKFQICTWIYA